MAWLSPEQPGRAIRHSLLLEKCKCAKTLHFTDINETRPTVNVKITELNFTVFG